MNEIIGIITTVLIIGVGMTMYFIPAIIATNRDHRNQGTILFLNLILGWTFFIWLALILWAVIERREPRIDDAQMQRYLIHAKDYLNWKDEALTREQFLADERRGYMS